MLFRSTENEFEYNLGLLRKRNYGILYEGFHGSGGTIFLHDKSEIDLAEIAEMMGGKAYGEAILESAKQLLTL